MIPAALDVYVVRDNDQKIPFTFQTTSGGVWQPVAGDVFTLEVASGGVVLARQTLTAVTRTRGTEFIWSVGRATTREMARAAYPIYRLDRRKADGNVTTFVSGEVRVRSPHQAIPNQGVMTVREGNVEIIVRTSDTSSDVEQVADYRVGAQTARDEAVAAKNLAVSAQTTAASIVSSVSGAIANVNSTAASLATMFSAVDGKVSQASAAAATATSGAAAATAAVSGLVADVNAVSISATASFNALQGQVTSSTSAVSALSGTVTSLTGQVSTAGASVTALMSSVADANGAIAAAGAKIDAIAVRPSLFAGATVRDRILAADDFVRTHRGTKLLIDGEFELSAPVDLKCEAIDMQGRCIIPSTFNGNAGGYCFLVGKDSRANNKGRFKGAFWIEGTEYFGIAAGTWKPSLGAFPSPPIDRKTGAPVPILLNHSFRAIDDGTVNGVAFVKGDLVRAKVANPSTTIYAANWAKVPGNIAGVRVDGLAQPHASLYVDGRHLDTVVHIKGNVERCVIEVGAAECHRAIREQSILNSNPNGPGGPGDHSSADNNKYLIRGSSCGQWYTSDEGSTVLNEVTFACQDSLSTYGLDVVDVRAQRKWVARGFCRGNFAPIKVVQGLEDIPFNVNGGVDFDLLLTSPRSFVDPVDGRNHPVLDITTRGMVTGKVVMTNPYGGTAVRNANGCHLVLSIEGQCGGKSVLQIGDTAAGGRVDGSRFSITAWDHDQPGAGDPRVPADFVMLDLQNHVDCDFAVLGDPLPIVCTDLDTKSRLVVPVDYVEQGVTGIPITGSDSAGIEVQFVGMGARADFDLYPQRQRGMRGVTARGVYTYTGTGDGVDGGSGWQYGYAERWREFTLTGSGTGLQTFWTVTHNLGAAPTLILASALSADAAGDIYYSNIGTTTFRINFRAAPPAGTDNVVVRFRASTL